MDPDLFLDDLPAEARALLDENERECQLIRDEAERQADELRARAERAAAEVVSRATEQVRDRQLALLRQLKPMQDGYAKKGKLDEALAIRDRIRGLKASLLQTQPDPGTLAVLPAQPAGTQVLFDVVGNSNGIVWGTDVYTHDSDLSSVAVHAGVLRDGERGIVRVTYADTLNVAFTGSERNGVWSEPFGPWPVGFRVERA
jgi:hypothetical protein